MRILLPLMIMLLLGGLCSCEYPEQGYYELVGLDADGRLQGRQLFIVEEYVDDSEMTTGFGLLLPHIDGDKLVSVPLENREGFDARGWTLRTNVRQTGHGNLLLELIHYDERLKMQGSLHVPEREQPEEFHATVRSKDGISMVMFVGAGPSMPAEFNGATRWQVRPLEAEAFEALCGLTIDSQIVPLMPWDMYESGETGSMERSEVRDGGPDRGDPPPVPTR